MKLNPCDLFSKVNFSENDPIFHKLRMNALKNCVPLFVSLELTQKCNFSCRHCYNFDRTAAPPPPGSSKSKPVPTLEDWKRVLQQIKKTGGLFLSFTGGEVLLSPYLLPLLECAGELGFSSRLKSNAALITEAWAKKLKKLRVEQIEVSFYGIDQTTHDSFTGTQSKLRSVQEGIIQAKKAGLDLMINIILHRGNIKEYPKMKSWIESQGLDFQVSFDMTTRHDGTDGSLDHRVSVKELEELFFSKEGQSLLPKKNLTGNIQCGCARINCGIGQDGSVYPCIGAPILSGNILEEDFQRIWESSSVFQEIRGLRSQDFKTCHKCPDRYYCQRSSGLMYLNTGDYTGAEEATCETAALIKKMNL